VPSIQAPILNYRQAYDATVACILVGRTPCLWGAPGIGKTAIQAWLETDERLSHMRIGHIKGKAVAKLCEVFIASNVDSIDISGLKYVDPETHALLSVALAEIEKAVQSPTILIIDEFTTVPPSVQGPLLRLILERVAGSTPLHPESRIIVIANPPEHAPGSFDLSAATMNRLIHIIMVPAVSEVARWFAANVGEEGSALRAEAIEWAATVEFLGTGTDTGLADLQILQLEPPAAAITGSTTWGSSRAWHAGLEAFTKADELGLDKTVQVALLEGAVGAAPAQGYLGIKKLHQYLPSKDEVKADPTKAKVPTEKKYQVAVVGLLARVAHEDLWAAWVYAARLTDEIKMVVAQYLVPLPPPAKSKWRKQGEAAKLDILVNIRGAITGTN